MTPINCFPAVAKNIFSEVAWRINTSDFYPTPCSAFHFLLEYCRILFEYCQDTPAVFFYNRLVILWHTCRPFVAHECGIPQWLKLAASHTYEWLPFLALLIRDSMFETWLKLYPVTKWNSSIFSLNRSRDAYWLLGTKSTKPFLPCGIFTMPVRSDRNCPGLA